MRLNTELRDDAALRQMVSQCQRAGIRRRAVMLHTERLPSALARPHHLRLAREALGSLANADRAQTFELPQGRVVIVWRSRGGPEVADARAALAHLLTGQPDQATTSPGELLTLYDLPEQAEWLLDEIAQADPARPRPAASRHLDATQLAGLEAQLGQADVAHFTRWRPVMKLAGPSRSLAWEERYLAIDEIAASLCPGVALAAEPWLYRRLTRTLDRRMLAMLTTPRELRGNGAFSLQLNVETILSADFLRLDEALPLALRGRVILKIDAIDLLSDAANYEFARRFAQARGYRIALACAGLGLLAMLDLARLEPDIVHVPWSTDLAAAPGAVRLRVPAHASIVLEGLDRAGQADWAARSGFTLGSGYALSC